MLAIQMLLLAAEIIIFCPILYLCALSFSAIVYTKKRRNQALHLETPEAPLHSFAILIPAYNEEMLLGTLLENLSCLVYPKDLHTVYVIADNCTDNTAALARKFEGVQVYERADLTKRGKGYALNWMFQQLDVQQLSYDAYVILDADSVVEPSFLQAMNRELASGAKAMQAHYTVLNTLDSPSTILRWIALTLVNYVRPLGRNALGASSTLTGNGMCLSRELLRQYPWQAFSLAEDYQYYLSLVQHGERVRYIPEAVVRSHMPTTFEQMRTQDIRWESANPAQSNGHVALGLLKSGLQARDLWRIEAAVELLTPPLSSLVACCLLLLLVAIVLWSLPQILFGIVLLIGLVCYISSAFYFLRPSRSVYIALLHTPAFIAWKLWVYVVLRRSKKHTAEWVRTSRTFIK